MKKDTLYAGYGRVCITPTKSIYLCGYPEERPSNEVGDDLFASCTALRDAEGNTALLFTIDIIHYPTKACNTIRETLEKETGVPYGNIILNATHSHASYEPPVEELAVQCVEAAKLALADLSECEVYTAVRETYGMTFCRRYLDKEGNLFSYGPPRSVIWGFETKPDENVYLIKFTREGKKDIVLANFATHSDTIMGCEGRRYTISADFIGSARKYFEASGDAYLSYHMGPCGDLNPVNTPYPFYSFPGTDKYGKMLAREIEEGLYKAEKLEGDKTIRSASVVYDAKIDHSKDNEVEIAKKICAAYESGNKEETSRLLKEQGYSTVFTCHAILSKAASPVSVPIELGAIAVGDLAFAASPYEMFNDTGLQIREGSKFKMTFVCSYSNGFNFYLPTIKGFEHGGYEMQSCRYAPGTAEESGETYVEMINKLHD